MNGEFRQSKTKIPLDKNIEDTTDPITKNSTAVYINNDSFNLNSIPFEVDDISEERTNEDIEID